MSKLKELRTKQNLRLVDLARISGVSIGWIWNLEQGYHKGVSKKIKEKLAIALKIPLEKIFPNSEEREG